MNNCLLLLLLHSCLSINIDLMVGNTTQLIDITDVTVTDPIELIPDLTISRWKLSNTIVSSQQVINKVTKEIDFLTEEMLRITNTIINIGGEDLSLDCLNGHPPNNQLLSFYAPQPPAGSTDECFNLQKSQISQDIIIIWISHGYYCRSIDMNDFDNSEVLEWDQSYFTHNTEFDSYGNWYRSCRLSVGNLTQNNDIAGVIATNSVHNIRDLTTSRWKLSNTIVLSQQIMNKVSEEINVLTEEMLRITTAIMAVGGENLSLDCLNGHPSDQFNMNGLWYSPQSGTSGSPDECYAWQTSQVADDIIIIWISGSRNGRTYCRSIDMNGFDHSDGIEWDQSYFTHNHEIGMYGQWYRSCRLSSSVN